MHFYADLQNFSLLCQKFQTSVPNKMFGFKGVSIFYDSGMRSIHYMGYSTVGTNIYAVDYQPRHNEANLNCSSQDELRRESCQNQMMGKAPVVFKNSKDNGLHRIIILITIIHCYKPSLIHRFTRNKASSETEQESWWR